MIIDNEFEIVNEMGMHARPSASFVKLANKFKSDITVEHNDFSVNGKSILGLLTLAAERGSKLKLIATGTDAKIAIKKLGNLISSGFNEK